jgi:hypothetical protein
VLDERGHAENFKRIEVRVAGPDGFSATVPLDAAGAGAYAGSLPLARPGAYVATAIDEQTNEVLGTTAAALSAGEELRPTGTDRGALRQVANVSGGKMRDTLAGIFSDREALRFAYQNLNQLLAILAAIFLLLGVATRRLAVPEVLVHASSALGTWLARPKKRRASRTGAPHPPSPGLEALRQAKARTEAERLPSAGQRLPDPIIVPSRPTAPVARVATPSRPPARQATAAEILLARRKGKKP